MQGQSTCSVGGCEVMALEKGLCNAHYLRNRRHGNPTGGQPAYKDTEARFWAKVNKGGPVPEYAPALGPCWIWGGAIDDKGYGRFRNGAVVYAHRFAYEMLYGDAPASLRDLDHLCRVTACVRPDHLEAVTHLENMRRSPVPSRAALFQASKTHCPKGHPYDEGNTGTTRTGRYCRTCANVRNSANYWRRKEAGQC